MDDLLCHSALAEDITSTFANEHFHTVEIVAYCALAPLSILFGVTLVWLYAKRSSLRNPPGDLIFCQIMCQFVTDLTWLYPALSFAVRGSIQDGVLCDFIGLTSSYSVFAACGYNLALSIEIFQKINKPFNTSYTSKLIIYHTLTHAGAIGVTLVNAATKTFGLTKSHNCFLNLEPGDSSKPSLIPLTVLFLYEVATVWLVFYIFMRLYYAKREVERNLLFRHSLFVFVSFLLFVLFPGYLSMDIVGFILQSFSYEVTENALFMGVYDIWVRVACVAGCLSGTILCLVRMSDIFFKRNSRAAEHAVDRVRDSQASSLPEEPGAIPDSFKEMLFETLLSTLLSLHLVFKLKMKYSNRQCPQLHSNRNSNSYHLKQLWELDAEQFKEIPQQDEFLKKAARWYKIGLFEYSPNVFKNAFTHLGFDEQDLAESFDPIGNIKMMYKHAGNRGGRSDAFIYKTADKRFIIKTLKKRELDTIRQTLKAMTDYYGSPFGQYSLLARFLGIFTLYFQGRSAIHIAVMENIIPPSANVVALFDLKGSVVNRQTLNDLSLRTLDHVDPGSVLKDLDFKQVVGTLPLPDNYFRFFHGQLKEDCNKLRALNLMDYSLLVALCRADLEALDSRFTQRIIKTQDPTLICFVGVIDFLQRYSISKKLEKSKNGLLTPRTPLDHHSCVPPPRYAQRLRDFLLELFPCAPKDTPPLA